jgi:hypothetical protein
MEITILMGGYGFLSASLCRHWLARRERRDKRPVMSAYSGICAKECPHCDIPWLLSTIRTLLASIDGVRLIEAFWDDEAEVFVGEYVPMKIMSQGVDREEAEIAAIEAVLMHIGVSAALAGEREDAGKGKG